MSWQDRYRAKLCAPGAAVADLRPGDNVYMGGNAATPRVLADAHAHRAAEVEGLTVGHVLLLGIDPGSSGRGIARRSRAAPPTTCRATSPRSRACCASGARSTPRS